MDYMGVSNRGGRPWGIHMIRTVLSYLYWGRPYVETPYGEFRAVENQMNNNMAT